VYTKREREGEREIYRERKREREKEREKEQLQANITASAKTLSPFGGFPSSCTYFCVGQ
jgi:hypothetical protein